MNTRHVGGFTRRVLLAFAMSYLAMGGGCAHQPRTIPLEVALEPGTKEWMVVTAESAGELPDMVPIVCVVNGQKQAGLLLERGTPQYEAAAVREDIPGRGIATIRLPSKVVFSGGRGVVRVEKRLITNESLDEASSVPLEVFVPVLSPDGRQSRPVPGFKGEVGTA